MKKFYSTLLTLSFLVCLPGCSGCGGGGGNNDSNNGAGGSVTIKGTLAGGVNSNAIDASQVVKVVVFSGSGWSSVANLNSDGSFELSANTGTPIGLIFAGATDNFLGYLTLGGDIDSIPLTKITDGVTTIDLQTISSDGIIATPGYNPIGTELPLSSPEQIAMAQCNGMFASIVKNPDVDGNGVIDILESKFYRPFIAYGVSAGHFSGGLTPTINSTVTMDHYNVTISSQSAADAGGATVTGPGITGETCSESSGSNQVMYSIYSNLGSSPTTTPTAGEYKIALQNGSGTTLTFSIPDQSQASSKIVVAVPTVGLNSNGTINKVSWVYRMPNDPASELTPTALIESIMIQINDDSMTRLYDSPMVASDIVEHILTDQTIRSLS